MTRLAIYLLLISCIKGKGAKIAQSVQSSSDALDNRGLVAVKYFSLLQSVHKGSGAHPASCSKGTGGSLPKETAAETRSWPRTSIWCHWLRTSESCLSPACAFMECTETSLPLPYQYVTTYIEKNPWEANSSSDSQNIHRILYNMNVYYRVHKSTPLVPTVSHMNPVHALPLYTLLFSDTFYFYPRI